MTIRPKYDYTSRQNKVTRPSKKERDAAYEAVALRSGGVCECCGRAPAEAVHHRLYRSRGGEDTVENMLAVCGVGNVDKCHGVAHTLVGEQLGWSVRSGNDPALIPIFQKATGTWSQNGAPILAATAVELMVTFRQIRQGMN